MSWISPNYAKGLGGGLDEEEVLELVQNNFLIPVYEPILIGGDFVLTVGGDLLFAVAYKIPLELIP